MIRARRPWACLVAVGAAFAALACGSALAFFTTTGEGSVDAGVSNLAKPTIASATAAIGGTVTVTWGAVTPPQTGTVTYYVTRDGEPASGTCPTESAPAAVTTCIDKNVEPGAHSYNVTAVWRTWSAESNAKAVTVTVGAPTHLTISAATTSPVAGAADNLTIAAKDVNETTVTTYTGAKSLVFSGASASPGGTNPTVSNSSGTATAFGATTAITFAAGVSTVNTTTRNGVLRIYRAGVAELAVSDGTISTETPLSLSVSPAALSKFVLGVETTTPAAGAADDLTVTALDTYSNPVIGQDGIRMLTFSGASASPGGNLPTVSDAEGEPVPFATPTAIEFDEGVAKAAGVANGEMRLYKSGSTSIKVTEGAITSATVAVVPVAGAASKLALTASTLVPVSGAAVSLTHTAQDVYGNTATTYTGAKNLTFSGAAAGPSGNLPTVANSAGTAIAFGATTAINFTNGVASTSSSKNGSLRIYLAEPAAITVSDGTISNAVPLAITVSTGTFSKFVLAADSTTPVAGAVDDLTITAADTYGNAILAHDGAKTLTFSGASASPGGNVSTVSDYDGDPVAFGTAMQLWFINGVATALGPLNGEMRLYRVGATTVKATEGTISGTLVVTPTHAPAAKFALTSSASTIAANGTANLTTTAQDPYGNTATAYAGAKILTFGGASASPGGTAPTVVNSAGTAIAFGSDTALTFTNGVAAVASSKNGLVRLFRSGLNAITVTDETISTVSPANVTVTATTAAKLIWVGLDSSAGSVSSTCLFTCTVTGLGNSGWIMGRIAVTDTYGNVNSNIGTGHNAAVTVTGGGAVTSGTFTFPSTGLAESAGEFKYTAPSSGSFTASLKAAATAGTAYTNATATATK